MQLLILGMNYAPEVTGIGPYTAGLAEHLVSRGHQVTVATAFPHYPEWRVKQPYRGRWRLVEHRGGVEVRRGAIYLPRRRSAVRRMLYDSSLAAGALVNGLSAARPDFILCISPPIQLGLTAMVLSRLWRSRFGLLIQDLPLEAALAVGMLRRGPVYRLGRFVERLVYRAAASIIVISEGFRQSVIRQGVPADRIAHIPGWVDTELVRPLAPDPELRSFAGAGPEDFLVLHTGNMGDKQGLASAVLAAADLDGDVPLRLTLVGDGMDRPNLEALAAERAAATVRFLPLQSQAAFARLLASADALLLNQRASVVDSVAPSKLLSYLAAGRPVLAAVHAESEAARIVRASGGGLIVRPEDPGALSAALRSLAQDPEHGRSLGVSGRHYAEAHFAREAVLARYDQFFEQFARRRSGRDVPLAV